MGLGVAWASAIGTSEAATELGLDPRLAKAHRRLLESYLDVLNRSRPESLHRELEQRCAAEPETHPLTGFFGDPGPEGS